MNDRTAPVVTNDHLQRAFEQARRPDWPPTLHELLTAVARAKLVQGLAQRLAKGQGMSAALDEVEPAPPPLRRSDFPPRPPSARALGHTERRRRDDQGVDLKSRAAGEREDE